MIRNTKNIKKIKLLYDESEKNDNKSDGLLKESKATPEELVSIPMFTKKDEVINITEELNTKYIKRDIIKTTIFFVLALVFLFVAYRTNLFAMIFVK